jgi:ribonuclease BN (tRNA processing enzyme)
VAPGRRRVESCAGFLLEYDEYRVVLDLGYALPQLLKHCPDGAVDALIVTHQHPDHCVDVSALARVRYYQAPDASPIPLYCPPGVVDVLRALEPRPDPATVFEPGRSGKIIGNGYEACETERLAVGLNAAGGNEPEAATEEAEEHQTEAPATGEESAAEPSAGEPSAAEPSGGDQEGAEVA